MWKIGSIGKSKVENDLPLFWLNCVVFGAAFVAQLIRLMRILQFCEIVHTTDSMHL